MQHLSGSGTKMVPNRSSPKSTKDTTAWTSLPRYAPGPHRYAKALRVWKHCGQISAPPDWTFAIRNSTFAIPMFPLHTDTFPSSASDLERLLNESLQRSFVADSPPVTVREHSYPHLEAITVSLDGARLRADAPRPSLVDETSPALEVDGLTLSASPLSAGPATFDLSLAATGVQLFQGKDSNGQIVLSLDDATDGNIAISLARADLEALVFKLAQDQAEKHGITVDGVQLKLRQENAHAVAAEVTVRARKLFLSASIRVTGRLDLDDELNLKLSGLNCTGEGAIGTMACGVLTPYLQKVDGREFPLMALPLGKIRLREVQLTVGDKLAVTAQFGSAR